jgi:hypothetical protein
VGGGLVMVMVWVWVLFFVLAVIRIIFSYPFLDH